MEAVPQPANTTKPSSYCFGAIKVDPLISGVADLKDGGEWFHRLYRNDEGLMKIILKP